MQTNGVSARYGLHPYAVVNAITKSGTNQIHGSLFEFVRNGALNARNFFAPAQDSLRRNQFGGTVGGPIRKDKIFLFNGFQATRTRTARSSSQPRGTARATPTRAPTTRPASTSRTSLRSALPTRTTCVPGSRTTGSAPSTSPPPERTSTRPGPAARTASSTARPWPRRTRRESRRWRRRPSRPRAPSG